MKSNKRLFIENHIVRDEHVYKILRTTRELYNDKLEKELLEAIEKDGLTISPERAQYLLNVRDALVDDNIQEAYHFLSKFYNPPLDKYSDELWIDIEAIAERGNFEKYKFKP